MNRERREALWHNCRALKQGLRSLGFRLGQSQESPILPLIVGDADALHGIFRTTLAEGSLCAGHSPADRAGWELRACASR